MHLDIQLLPVKPSQESLHGRSVVVIDVLRATSVMVQAFSQGLEELFPVPTVEEALELRERFGFETTLLGGERGGKQIEGFHFGNSPREYTADRVKGRRLIMTTTNGTKAFHSVTGGAEILVGSFFNALAVADRVLSSGRDLLIYPSGNYGKFSLEDTVCGGLLIDLIMVREPKERGTIDLSDAAFSARVLYQRFEKNLLDAFYLSSHGRYLASIGLEEDLPYCAQRNITDVVPVFKDGMIRARK